jgi:hypothetical protein
MPVSKPGVRAEIVSLEPIILLSVTRKVADVSDIEVSQPLYLPAWQAGDVTLATNGTRGFSSLKASLAGIPHCAKLAIFFRNISLLFGLAAGKSRLRALPAMRTKNRCRGGA